MQKIENVYKKGQKPIPFYFVEDYCTSGLFPFDASTATSFNFEAT